MEHGVAEPISEVGWLAAFAVRRRRLRLAFRGTGRAGDAHVEVIVGSLTMELTSASGLKYPLNPVSKETD